MRAVLYGHLAIHKRHDPLTAESDVYSLFVARSSAMGWLTEPIEGAARGLWGMNDAEQELRGEVRRNRIAWFQVDLTEVASLVLPTQPFLACVGDVVARIGALQLEAVQILLPLQALGKTGGATTQLGAGGTLAQTAGWFTDRDPHSRAKVRVALEGGQIPTIGEVAPDVFRWTREFKQDIFLCDSFSLGHDDALTFEPAIREELWVGPAARHSVTFFGTLTEWSLDALAWTAAFLTEGCHRLGVGTPLLLTAGRSEGADTKAAAARRRGS